MGKVTRKRYSAEFKAKVRWSRKFGQGAKLFPN